MDAVYVGYPSFDDLELKVINGVILYFQTAKLSGDMTYDGKSLLDRDIFTLSGGEKTAFAFVHG